MSLLRQTGVKTQTTPCVLPENFCHFLLGTLFTIFLPELKIYGTKGRDKQTASSPGPCEAPFYTSHPRHLRCPKIFYG